MAVRFLGSAGKHGFAEDDALNAIANAVWKRERFDVSRVSGVPDPTLWVGPALDGTELEVMTFTTHGNDVVIFHCMPLRAKFRSMMEGERL